MELDYLKTRIRMSWRCSGGLRPDLPLTQDTCHRRHDRLILDLATDKKDPRDSEERGHAFVSG